MKYSDFYKQIYDVIGESTPIGVDCGQLCQGACCQGDDETGMYLFPGEECMYRKKEEWFHISDSEFNYKLSGKEKNCPIFICKDNCPREKRPFACRIFPLFPYVDMNWEMKVILDPRGRGICPLAIMENSDLDSQFVKRVTRAGKIMMKIPLMREYLFSLSRLIDEYTDF